MRFVELKGEVPPDQMPLYLNAADCLVLASESEGSPNIVKEALACNLPIAAVGDVAERLRDVNPSRVVHRDAHELGMAIADILAQQKRSNGRNKVAELADDRIASQLKTIYQAAARISRNGQQH
jgi:glycosyltransferase involved in cell wall biosynthesis